MRFSLRSRNRRGRVVSRRFLDVLRVHRLCLVEWLRRSSWCVLDLSESAQIVHRKGEEIGHGKVHSRVLEVWGLLLSRGHNSQHIGRVLDEARYEDGRLMECVSWQCTHSCRTRGSRAIRAGSQPAGKQDNVSSIRTHPMACWGYITTGPKRTN